jgi:hypothetical protein
MFEVHPSEAAQGDETQKNRGWNQIAIEEEGVFDKGLWSFPYEATFQMNSVNVIIQ